MLVGTVPGPRRAHGEVEGRQAVVGAVHAPGLADDAELEGGDAVVDEGDHVLDHAIHGGTIVAGNRWNMTSLPLVALLRCLHDFCHVPHRDRHLRPRRRRGPRPAGLPRRRHPRRRPRSRLHPPPPAAEPPWPSARTSGPCTDARPSTGRPSPPIPSLTRKRSHARTHTEAGVMTRQTTPYVGHPHEMLARIHHEEMLARAEHRRRLRELPDRRGPRRARPGARPGPPRCRPPSRPRPRVRRVASSRADPGPVTPPRAPRAGAARRTRSAAG